MVLDRRQLLRGSLAAGAGATLWGLSTGMVLTADNASAAVPAVPRAAGFNVALLNTTHNVVENYNTADIRNNAFSKPPWAKFPTGVWQPLECKVRTLDSKETVFMVCGGKPDNGHVTIHRSSDAAALGWISELKIFPHSLEYVPQKNVIVVVGTRGLDDPSSVPDYNPGATLGGTWQVYKAPGSTPGQLVKIAEGPFRQAHGVVWQGGLLWMFGGHKLVGYEVHVTSTSASIKPTVTFPEPEPKLFENGHDLSADPVSTEGNILWVSSSTQLLKINKSSNKPRVDERYPIAKMKSFSRHSSGRSVWTVAPSASGPDRYGNDEVNCMWPTENNKPVKVPNFDGQVGMKRIYKARVLPFLNRGISRKRACSMVSADKGEST